ncbi:MAG: TIR domain-containing protein [Ktedonobacteraceae bacterium]|nr:TIR domain-containing protein [Ktedonobacteraceae bacterium]
MTRQHKQDNLAASVFISYAHADEALREELEKHLSSLQREGLIATWKDRDIVAGADWAREIDDAINSATVILLLISADFVASDYCYGIELQRALERQSRSEARVIPILLRQVDWQHLPFAHLQCLPRNACPITSWSNQDEAFADVAQGIHRVLDQLRRSSQPLPVLSSTDRQNRTRMLKRVRVFWIEGVLMHSLHQAARIELGLQEQPDALANPWRLIVQEANLPPRPLPAGTCITQVYDQADGELLILGEPGSGKTTLLLELASELLTRAEQDSTHRIPVVFNLSSWAQKRVPLTEWLVEELSIRYEVPRKVGRAWVEQERILPLLDGLDEVQQEARSACVAAINDFRRQFRSVSPVVCSRTTEYFAQKQRVAFLCAVTIQPLTPLQIDVYLTSTQGQLEAIRIALHKDTALQELTTTPLMLTVLVLAYPGKSIDDLLAATSREAQQRHLFETYVERMLTRRGSDPRFSVQQTTRWISWLARQMHRRGQTTFFIERMQPDWLSDPQTHRIYRVGFGLLNGQLVSWIGALVGGLNFGLVFGLVFWLVGWLLGGLFSARGSIKIEPAEIVTWSWKKAWRGFGLGLVIMLIVNLVGILITVLVSLLANGLVNGLFFAPAGGLSGLTFGLSKETLKENSFVKPNEGIWRSARNGIRYGVMTWLISLPLLGLIVMLIGRLGVVLVVWLVVGLGGGLLLGGRACIQHLILRALLWHAKSIPWNYPRFLDYAAERILLRKVGGGYVFVHRLLLDYFAELDDSVSPGMGQPSDRGRSGAEEDDPP